MTTTADAVDILREQKVEDFTFLSIGKTLYALMVLPVDERKRQAEKILDADWYVFTELNHRWLTRNVKAYLATGDTNCLCWE
jgi:hypothetical protein